MGIVDEVTLREQGVNLRLRQLLTGFDCGFTAHHVQQRIDQVAAFRPPPAGLELSCHILQQSTR